MPNTLLYHISLQAVMTVAYTNIGQLILIIMMVQTLLSKNTCYSDYSTIKATDNQS
jgi:hypothetical protein